MPEQVRCPECDAALRVPDNLLGKKVKCPKCQTAFVAELDEPAPPQGIVREPAPSSRRSRVPEEIEDDEEEFPSEDEEEERPRSRKKSRRRSAKAASAVAGPAISLIVLGGLDLFLIVVDVILGLAGINAFPVGGGKAGQPAVNLEILTSPVFLALRAFVAAGFAAVILLGGIRMKQLQSYGLAMAASILAILPCGNCCCIGLPLGIWALMVLNKPEVKDAFS